MTERNLYNAPEGATVTPVVVVVIQYYWGRGTTIDEAWDNVKKVSGVSRAMVRREKSGYLVYSTFDVTYGEDDDRNVKAHVDGMGSINYQRDYPAVLIESRKAGEPH